MATLPELIDNYLGGITTLRQAVAGMSRQQLLARPVAGKWSTLECVCHLTDFEPIYADRMKRVIAEERPPLSVPTRIVLQPSWPTTNATWKKNSPSWSIHGGRWPESCAPCNRQPWLASASTMKLDPTLEKLLNGAINHINHHVKFIKEKRHNLRVAGVNLINSDTGQVG